MAAQDKIERLRRSVDGLDNELLLMLNRRAELAVRIGCLKRELGMPVSDAIREAEILARLAERNRGPLDNEAVTGVFRAIIEACCALQEEEEGR